MNPGFGLNLSVWQTLICIIKINCLYIVINAKLACCVRTLVIYAVAGHENNSFVKCVLNARGLSNRLPEPTVTYVIH